MYIYHINSTFGFECFFFNSIFIALIKWLLFFILFLLLVNSELLNCLMYVEVVEFGLSKRFSVAIATVTEWHSSKLLRCPINFRSVFLFLFCLNCEVLYSFKNIPTHKLTYSFQDMLPTHLI